MRWLLLWIILAAPAGAQSHKAGEFDYFVLSLSWSPNWCALEGDARNSEQCDARHDHGWIMHGLWPQFERGYPEFCQTAKQPPSRGMTTAMSDIMGTPGLAWYQWRKHGSCTNYTAAAYYTAARDAYDGINRPAVLRKITETYRIAPSVIEDAFLQSNPEMRADQITITCRNDHIQEARVCLTKELELRACGPDVRRDCTAKNALFTPIR